MIMLAIGMGLFLSLDVVVLILTTILGKYDHVGHWNGAIPQLGVLTD